MPEEAVGIAGAIPSEVLEVRVVGGGWVDAVLPAIAIVISVATLVWTIWSRRSDQARVGISSSISIPTWTPGPAQRLIGIEVTNVGRAGSTVLRSVHLRVGRRGGSLWIVQPALGVGPTYPHTLQPGEHVNLLVDPVSIARTCADEGIDPGRLRVVASTGHGECSTKLRKNAAWLVRDVAR